MKSHFTIRRAPSGDAYKMRLFLTEEDAKKFRYEDRILVTRNGKDWQRYGYAGQVFPEQREGGWSWDCSRRDKTIPDLFQGMEPKERRYYGIRLTIEGIFVKNGTPIEKEEIE